MASTTDEHIAYDSVLNGHHKSFKLCNGCAKVKMINGLNSIGLCGSCSIRQRKGTCTGCKDRTTKTPCHGKIHQPHHSKACHDKAMADAKKTFADDLTKASNALISHEALEKSRLS